MADIRDTRRKLQIAIGVLAAIDVVAVGLLLSPLIGSSRDRQEQQTQLWKELQVKTREVEPLQNVDKKIVTARGQIADFYKTRLPGTNSAISEELGKLAGENGVKIGQIRYKPLDPEPVGLHPIEIQADFEGDYLHLVRFINGLERDPLFFIINSVQLGGEQAGVVKLQMKLETYLKTGA
jgi:type IV pilus assembly protein PilO